MTSPSESEPPRRPLRFTRGRGTTRNPRRIAIMLAALRVLWIQCPDMRLGQLIYNLTSPDIFYLEDDVLLDRIQKASRGDWDSWRQS